MVKLQIKKNSFLALENGKIFRGVSIGYKSNTVGEVVFNTGMTGYQEILTDPSYAGQIVTMTYPAMGNYGITQKDFESQKPHANGLIINENNAPSNWNSVKSLQDFLIENQIPCISEIDTRALTLTIREHGSLKAYLVTQTEKMSEQKAIDEATRWIGLEQQDYAQKVSCKQIEVWNESKNNTQGHIVVYDFGVKLNILRNLSNLGLRITLVPAKTPYEKVLALKPDGIVFSNGPADPSALDYAIENAKQLITKNIPILGICLGHQILGLALNCSTYKMPFGHHGINHPVKNLINNTVEITSQNHNFALDAHTVNEREITITHINLNDNTIAGIAHKTYPIFSVQYHPEAGPGPSDSLYLFAKFKKNIKDYQEV